MRQQQWERSLRQKKKEEMESVCQPGKAGGRTSLFCVWTVFVGILVP